MTYAIWREGEGKHIVANGNRLTLCGRKATIVDWEKAEAVDPLRDRTFHAVCPRCKMLYARGRARLVLESMPQVESLAA